MNQYEQPNSQRRVLDSLDVKSLIPLSPVPSEPPVGLPPEEPHYEDPETLLRSQEKTKFVTALIIAFVLFLIFIPCMCVSIYLFLGEQNRVIRVCTPGYSLFEVTGFCYKVSVKQVRAEEARDNCIEEGGNLVSIHSEAENFFILSLYKGTLEKYRQHKYISMDRSSPWIGLAYDSDLETWRWSDDSPVDYTNWAADEPNNLDALPVLRFIEIDKLNELDNTGKWYDIGAIPHDKIYPTNRAYICKKGNSSFPIIRRTSFYPFRETRMPMATTQQPSKCPIGYGFFEETGFCYKVINQRMTAKAAHVRCQKEGAQLASIHSERENQYLADISRESNITIPSSEYAETLDKSNEVWIGMVRRNSKWLWSDGSELDFANWAVGEPNKLDFEMGTTLVTSRIAEYNPNGNRWNNVQEAGKQRALICKKYSMILLVLSSILLLSPSVSAQYDIFVFNVTMLCRHEGQYTFDATFNLRNEDPDRPITYTSIDHVNRQGNAGFARFVAKGQYEFEASRSPVWEPIAKIIHNCQAKGDNSLKKISLNFASVPALRKKVQYVYKFYIDITDKSGEYLPEAEITVKP